MSEPPTIPDLNPATQVLSESTSGGFCHELDEGCPCGPTTEAVKRDDGSVGWVFIHHSLDGRELVEPTT